MLTIARARADRLRIVRGTPALDSYGEPTSKWAFDLSTAVPLSRARLARPSLAVQEIEGVHLGEHDAALLILRRFTDLAGKFLVLDRDGHAWRAVSDPVPRDSLASGVLTAVHMTRHEVRR
ncbi:hypothetical protein J2Y69_003339 [Microbacterium resistens]|uniref:Uncharacterized protein n=1 Tax=Microbacterium resistens TaxID=156977 RepID=A0ABU1SGK0_9MICO|nr:hypothetical protein [Microbacterium resistens]MDR6868715.1 hypothetical protein [Microbacterium resistens]